MKADKWNKMSVQEQSKFLSRNGYIVCLNGVIFKCLN